MSTLLQDLRDEKLAAWWGFLGPAARSGKSTSASDEEKAKRLEVAHGGAVDVRGGAEEEEDDRGGDAGRPAVEQKRTAGGARPRRSSTDLEAPWPARSGAPPSLGREGEGMGRGCVTNSSTH